MVLTFEYPIEQVTFILTLCFHEGDGIVDARFFKYGVMEDGMGGYGQVSTKDAIIGGGIASLVGLFVVAVAIWGDDSGFHAPRWVVGAAGCTFLFAGIAILVQDHPRFSALVRALLLTTFGAVFTWVSFGPGERQFSSTVSIPFISITRDSSEITGRICFAPGAILLDGLALYTWFLFGRDWFLRNIREG